MLVKGVVKVLNMSVVAKTTGALVKFYIEQSGMGQGKIADKANISHVYMSNIVTNKKEPSIDVLFRISGALGISVYKLIPNASDPADIPDDEHRILSLYRRLKEINEQRAIGIIDYLEFNISRKRQTD